MKDYKRLTDREIAEMLRNTEGESWDSDNIEAYCYIRLAELEDKIESGELCEREEVRKETAKEISLLLGKGFDETARKDFKDLQWYKQFCRELELRYGIELFGKTEQVENFDKLEDEE